jgi:beta-1,4-mannosyl-glycoprotein beta-1,4-N-acetylglucosaminyltransferase
MIYDCFTLRDELDMLELRLKLLDNIVDKFVICEADKTFTNIEKPFNYINNIDRFRLWRDKIIYLPLNLNDKNLDFSHKDTSYNPTSAAWQFEYAQRNQLFQGIKNCKDDDIIFMGDLDEIPNIYNLSIDQPSVCVMNFYYYYLNNKSVGPRDSQWLGTTIVPLIFIKNYLNNDMQGLRNIRDKLYPIHNGWHLSYLGGKDAIQQKIKSYSHTEYNNNMFCNDAHIESCLKNGTDLFNRQGMNFKLVDLHKEYPEKIIQILYQYPQFIYQ